ncbi:hypothetical protein DES49_1759 [Halospina denitrificans]|uniref:Uncharacterized protein n=2 Tax=Halospina denitrificans TaxID=332522 RepID=A0A4R7JVX9_9GAMM|nr:hypothetical protein DES49_1759 [Halospina denitrificans]
MRFYRTLLVLIVLPLVGVGCASYQSHYSVIEAATSSGKERKVRLTWRTAHYPSWHWRQDKATPIRMETQCSRRVWRIKDPGMEESCSTDSIGACGDPALDLDTDRELLDSTEHQCITVSDEKGSDRILELGERVEVTVSCYPRHTEIEMGDETANADYLRASVVPYNFRVRAAPLGSLTQRPPELDDSVCDLDE